MREENKCVERKRMMTASTVRSMIARAAGVGDRGYVRSATYGDVRHSRSTVMIAGFATRCSSSASDNNDDTEFIFAFFRSLWYLNLERVDPIYNYF